MSIVVPVLNEAPRLAAALPALRKDLPRGAELIVVDGGSADGSPDLAARHATVLTAPAGRARQMNLGAAAANGEVLLFLHIDVSLPRGWHEAIQAVLAEPRVVAGGFLVHADPRSPALDFITALSNARSRIGRRFYGDQAIFVRASVFARVGGFDESLPLLEGYDLTRRLGRIGRLVHVSLYVRASSRRFLECGVWRTFLAFQVLRLRYFFGALTSDSRQYPVSLQRQDGCRTGPCEKPPLTAITHGPSQR